MYVIALLVIVVKNAAGLAASPQRLRARILRYSAASKPARTHSYVAAFARTVSVMRAMSSVLLPLSSPVTSLAFCFSSSSFILLALVHARADVVLNMIVLLLRSTYL